MDTPSEPSSPAPAPSAPGPPTLDPPAPPAPVRRRKERPQVLNLSEAELVGVLRPRGGRLDSPSNRYAGDWSENYLHRSGGEDADYAHVPHEDLEEPGDLPPDTTHYVQIEVENENRHVAMETGILESYDCTVSDPDDGTYRAFMKIQEIGPVLNNRVNLRDLQESIDALIGNLERELNKNKLSITC